MTAARWMVCVVLGAMVCVVAGWRLTSILFSMPGVGTGQLQFEPRSVNMGFVCPGEQRTFRVRVLNVGNGPLELGEVDASCGCTDLQLAARSVAPGGETGNRPPQQFLTCARPDATERVPPGAD